MANSNLKPCPFCGRAAELYTFHVGRKDVFFGYCNPNYAGCGAQGPGSSSEAAALEAWNRRTDGNA
jgi:Lar family restriction alleviation protein